jgi:hypothetical protein
LRVGARGVTDKEVWEYVTRTLTNIPDARAAKIDNLDELVSAAKLIKNPATLTDYPNIKFSQHPLASDYTPDRAAKIDNLDKSVSAVAGDVWNYASRTLSQTKFPFWSAIITQTQGSVTVPASGVATVTVQPSAGATWLIWVDWYVADSSDDALIVYYDYDGTTERAHTLCRLFGTYGLKYPHLHMAKILTDSLYAHLKFYNRSAAAVGGYYGYSGFKLSQPLWSPKRTSDRDLKPWKKPASQTLPSSIASLQKYAFDILGVDPAKPDDYALGIILEEDSPLAVDPTLNFPVERLTVVVKADVLVALIAKFKAGTADPAATGYRKYLDKWKLEGVDFGV